MICGACGHPHPPDGGPCLKGIWVDEEGEGVWRCSCQALVLPDIDNEEE